MLVLLFSWLQAKKCCIIRYLRLCPLAAAHVLRLLCDFPFRTARHFKWRTFDGTKVVQELEDLYWHVPKLNGQGPENSTCLMDFFVEAAVLTKIRWRVFQPGIKLLSATLEKTPVMLFFKSTTFARTFLITIHRIYWRRTARLLVPSCVVRNSLARDATEKYFANLETGDLNPYSFIATRGIIPGLRSLLNEG